jgi:16S rRNA (cytosine1402-N4)-methyltransferase
MCDDFTRRLYKSIPGKHIGCTLLLGPWEPILVFLIHPNDTITPMKYIVIIFSLASQTGEAFIPIKLLCNPTSMQSLFVSNGLLLQTTTHLKNFFDHPYSEDTSEIAAATTSTAASTKRRVRYLGKYPRSYGDKYKELAGDVDTVQKVLDKGMTPAGRHVPILLNECLQHLGLLDTSTREGPAFVVDCTLGYGGHSSGILWQLLNSGNQNEHRLLCFDRDSVEIRKATDRLNQIVREHSDTQQQQRLETTTNPVTTVNRNFRELRPYLASFNNGDCGQVTALLADLGLSSMQIDNAARGFTYKREGPLDMRMTGEYDAGGNNSTNSLTTETAYDLLSRINVKELTKMLKENSDEPYAEVIASAILGNPSKKQRHANIPSTTLELANVVRDAVRPLLSPPGAPISNKRATTTHHDDDPPPRRQSNDMKKLLDATVARVIQAIRIQVNAEFESLDELLADLPYILAPSGRAVVLTFHSGEDRRVKRAFKEGFKNGCYTSWSRDVVRPTAQERRDNPRSSCCKLRWVVRSDKVIT